MLYLLAIIFLLFKLKLFNIEEDEYIGGKLDALGEATFGEATFTNAPADIKTLL